MKQGSADDPFAEDADDGEGDGPAESGSEPADPEPEVAPDAAADRARATESDAATGPDDGTQRGSLPYIHARDGVKDGRTQRPVFLRDHVESGIDELVAEMESEFGGDVYKTDVTEAAMAVAQENPELVRAKLETWGYGWS